VANTGTLIADRHQQVILVLLNRYRLFSEGAEAWEDLTNNVLPGWESDDDDERRLAHSEAPVQSDTLEGAFPYQRLSVTQHTKRRLQEGVFTGELEGCDASW